MKLKPIINQLATFLPFFSDKFTDISTITAASASAGTATIETLVDHNLVIGQPFVATDIVPLTVIDTLVLEATNQVTCRTTIDHGLVTSFDFKTKSLTNITVDISDVAEIEYNGNFPIVDVPNRNAFIYQLPDAPTSAPTGTGLVAKYAVNPMVGAFTVLSVPTTTSLTYAIKPTDTIITTDKGNTHANFRITGAIDLQRAIDSYTKQSTNDYWIFVAKNGSIASKNRQILNDSVTTYVRQGQAFRQRLIDSLTIYAFIPTSDELSARNAMDATEDLKIALFKSFLRFPATVQFSAASTGRQFTYTFNSDSVAFYDTSFVVYQYIFDTNEDITFDDTFNPNIYAPFRNIQSTQVIDGNDIDYNANLDVDQDF